MSWVTLSLLSALALGLYEISRKISVKKVSPLLVLFCSTIISGLIMLPAVPGSARLDVTEHGWIVLKSVVICFSWTGEFFALRHIPLSLGMAIRSSAPLFTIAMAVFIFREWPSTTEWIGIGLVIIGYLQFIFLARYHKQKDKLRYRWLLVMVAATVLGVISGGLDRFLLKSTSVTPQLLQLWYSLYTPALFTVPVLVILLTNRSALKNTELKKWSWAIPCISVLLLISDRFYFSALSQQQSSLAVVFALRRSSVIVSVIIGGLFLAEEKIKEKAIAILCVFAGIVVLKIFGTI